MHWQGDEARGKRDVRRSRYAKMRLQAKCGKGEEYEPVDARLWVEVSPPPTRLTRRFTDREQADVWAALGWRGEM